MEIITRGAFCNVHLPLEPIEREVFGNIIRAGDAGLSFTGKIEPETILSLYNLSTRSYIEPVDEMSQTWSYRATYYGRQQWLRDNKAGTS